MDGFGIPGRVAFVGLSFGLGTACQTGDDGGGGFLLRHLVKEDAKRWELVCSCYAQVTGYEYCSDYDDASSLTI